MGNLYVIAMNLGIGKLVGRDMQKNLENMKDNLEKSI